MANPEDADGLVRRAAKLLERRGTGDKLTILAVEQRLRKIPEHIMSLAQTRTAEHAGAATTGTQRTSAAGSGAEAASGGAGDALGDGYGVKAKPQLAPGVKNPSVLLLKERVIALGFGTSKKYPMSADGDTYDHNTFVAVRRLQWHFGLNADGVVGDNTWTILLGHSEEVVIDLDDPSATPTIEKATPGYDELYAKGQANRKAHGDWGDNPPFGAKVGDYGDLGEESGWVVTKAGEVRVGGDYNWRFCNPGNIQWQGESYSRGINIQRPSNDVIFPTEEVGWTALEELLKMHYATRTVGDFAEKYLGLAKGGKSAYGDSPEAYAKSVAAKTGFDPSRVVGTLDDTEIGKLMHAIADTEGTRHPHIFHEGDSGLPPELAHVFDTSAG